MTFIDDLIKNLFKLPTKTKVYGDSVFYYIESKPYYLDSFSSIIGQVSNINFISTINNTDVYDNVSLISFMKKILIDDQSKYDKLKFIIYDNLIHYYNMVNHMYGSHSIYNVMSKKPTITNADRNLLEEKIKNIYNFNSNIKSNKFIPYVIHNVKTNDITINFLVTDTYKSSLIDKLNYNTIIDTVEITGEFENFYEFSIYFNQIHYEKYGIGYLLDYINYYTEGSIIYLYNQPIIADLKNATVLKSIGNLL